LGLKELAICKRRRRRRRRRRKEEKIAEGFSEDDATE